MHPPLDDTARRGGLQILSLPTDAEGDAFIAQLQAGAHRDAGWNLFTELLTVKAAWAGRNVVKVNPAYTSQTCSGCGVIRKKALSDRWHTCECGTSLVPHQLNSARCADPHEQV